MRYASEHKSETRQRILKAAANAIREDGVHKIAVAPVMAQAGLTQGGFYAHFSSRDDFVGAAVDQMFLESADRLLRSAEGRSVAEGLAAYVDFYLSRGHCESRTYGCPLPYLSADAWRLPPETRERIAAGVRGLTQRLSDRLRDMGREDADVEAASMLSEMVGAVSLARAEPDADRAELILARTRRSLSDRFGLALSH